MDPAVRAMDDDALASVFERTLNGAVSPSALDIPLLLRICLDELSEVAACTELRAALLREKIHAEGPAGPAEEKKIEDLWFAAEQMREATARILKRSATVRPGPLAEVRDLRP